MKSSRYWLVYSLIRVGIFAAALVGLLLIGVNVWVAAIVAAAIGFCVSYIFLRGARDKVARSIVDIRGSKTTDADNDLENEVLDRLEDDGRRKPQPE